jgi:hypothetical protein
MTELFGFWPMWIANGHLIAFSLFLEAAHRAPLLGWHD